MNIIIIPVYKAVPNENEKLSFNRCLNVLGCHPIIIVAPIGFNSSYYDETSKVYGITLEKKYFAESYFTGINGYNRLLLTYEFYSCFNEYEYMLIYQLDAYVFRDELIKWCDLGFDFMGAPLIGRYSDIEFSNFMRVGNGGFSLRKIGTFIQAYNHKKNLLMPNEIIKRFNVFKKPCTRIPLLILMTFGYKNKLAYFAKNWKYNEDDFWSGFLDKTTFSLQKPTPRMALGFSFERFPSATYEITKKLPFGCHGWRKYEYDKFWESFIK